MGKIFKIDIETTVYWYGEDFPKDWELARAAQGEIRQGNYDLSGQSLKKEDAENLLADDLEKYPYGDEGDRHTIAEWLENA